MRSDFYTQLELKELGFKKIGKNNLISRKVVFYNIEKISIGSNIRIDAFSVISAKLKDIKIGDYVHIGVNCYLNGSFGIKISSFCGISAGCKIFTSSEDFSGEYFAIPTVNKIFRKPIEGPVIMKKYANIGSNTIVLPNVIFSTGSVAGAQSLVNRSLNEWTIYFGSPVKKIKKRKKNFSKFKINI